MYGSYLEITDITLMTDTYIYFLTLSFTWYLWKSPGKRKIRNNESFFNKIQYSMKKDTD